MKRYNIPLLKIYWFKQQVIVTTASNTWTGELSTMTDESRRAVKYSEMQEVLQINFE